MVAGAAGLPGRPVQLHQKEQTLTLSASAAPAGVTTLLRPTAACLAMGRPSQSLTALSMAAGLPGRRGQLAPKAAALQ